MDKSVIKPILFGVLFGALAYAAPFFLIKAVIFFAILGAIFRFFAWRRFGPNNGYHFAFADTIRSMSEEDYTKFKIRYDEYSNCNKTSKKFNQTTEN